MLSLFLVFFYETLNRNENLYCFVSQSFFLIQCVIFYLILSHITDSVDWWQNFKSICLCSYALLVSSSSIAWTVSIMLKLLSSWKLKSWLNWTKTLSRRMLAIVGVRFCSKFVLYHLPFFCLVRSRSCLVIWNFRPD